MAMPHDLTSARTKGGNSATLVHTADETLRPLEEQIRQREQRFQSAAE